MALTLLETDEDTEHLVVEMGTSGKGELSYLSKRVRPERIIITTVAPAHLEGLEDLPGIIAAKAEIFEGLVSDGTAILNADDPQCGPLATMARKAGVTEIRTFELA